jgi:NADPH:quinone reductase-like Zn-dependent oxidoreductase
MTVTRRSMTIARSGGPASLALVEDQARDPGPGEIRVRAHAAGVNFADLFCAYGLYEAAPPPPFVCGFEVAGVVEAVGEGVDNRNVGDRVIQVTRFGGYADHVTAPAYLSLPLPDGASFEEGAAFPTVFTTAWYALDVLGHLKDGMRVLVHAAAGGVGTAALQLCKRFDVEVFATCSTQKLDVAKEHGADVVIDYTRENFARVIRDHTGGSGVDLVLDSIGGDVFKKSYDLLNPRGHLVSFGAATLTPSSKRLSPVGWAKLGLDYVRRPRLDPLQMVGENKTVSGFNLVHLTEDRPLIAQAMSTLGALYEEGTIAPVLGKTFAFEDAGDALEHLRNRSSVGKVVLTIPGETRSR